MSKPSVRALHEVPKHKRAPEALREAGERFRSAFSYAAIGMALVGTNGRWLQVNRSLCEIVGYSEQELLSRPFQDITHPDDLEPERFVGRIEELLRERRVVTGEELTLADGHVFERDYIPIFVGDDDYRGHLWHYRDITKRKRAEEALKESEERYRALMEQSVETIYLYDAKTKRVLESNCAFQKLMGYTKEELLGMEIYDFIAHDRANVDANIRRRLKEKRRHIGERRYGP